MCGERLITGQGEKVKLVIWLLKRLPLLLLQVSLDPTLHLLQWPHTIKPTAAPTFRIRQLIIYHPLRSWRTLFNRPTQQTSVFPRIHLCFLCIMTVHECSSTIWSKI